jgi:hypothetical protein
MSHTAATDATYESNLEDREDLDDDLDDEAPDEFDGEFTDRLSDGDDPLWNGDQGTLDARQRDTVVALLKKSFISSDDRVAWRSLTNDRDSIAVTLNNLYMILVVDERAEVAYATPARNADHPFKTLVRDAPNSREETLLLIYLRERHRAETASGRTVAYVDLDGMLAHVSRFRPPTATDVFLDAGRVRGAVAGLVTAGLLVKTRDEDRYRIHRAIEALLPLTTLNQLLEAFKRHNTNPDPDPDPAGEPGSDPNNETATGSDDTNFNADLDAGSSPGQEMHP